MKILITGGDSRLARAIASTLSSQAEIRLVDIVFSAEPPPNTEAIAGDIRHPDFARQVVEGQDMLLHLAPIAPCDLEELERLEYATRGTYVLFQQATEAGSSAVYCGKHP